MKSKLFFIFILCQALTLAAQDSLLPPNYHQITTGIGLNTKYLYVTPNLKYTSPDLFKRRISFTANYEGFRPVFFISEVNRLNFSARYRFNKGKFTTYPKVGFTLYFDYTDIFENSRGVYVMPTIGNFSNLRFNKFNIYLDQMFTFYSDGLWLELFPSFGYRVLPFMEPRIGMNTIMAFTYNGSVEVGLYPYLQITWYIKVPDKKKKR